MEFRDIRAIRGTPLNDPVPFRIVIPRAMSEALSKAARDHKTAAAEIARVGIEKILKEIGKDY